MRTLIATAFICTAGFVAALALAHSAKADPVTDYITANAPGICADLNQAPTVSTVESIIATIVVRDHYSGAQAGEIVLRSVIGWCPAHESELKAFADKWTPRVAT